MNKPIYKLVAIVLMSQKIASAAEANERAIYDLMYFPVRKTIFGISEIKHGKTNGSINATRTAGTQQIGYSFTDRFLVSGSAQYTTLNDDRSEISGFADPTLMAKFRLVESTVDLDLNIGSRIQLRDNEAETRSNSNGLNRGSNMSIGSQVGARRAHYQWALLSQYTRTYKTSTDNFDDNYGSLLFRFELLNKLSESYFFRSSLISSLQDLDNGGPRTLGLGAEIQKVFSENILLKGGAEYALIDPGSGIYKAAYQWNLSVKALYQF